MMNDEIVLCPLLGKQTDFGACIEITDVCEKLIKEDNYQDVTSIPNWREVCINCQYHNI